MRMKISHLLSFRRALLQSEKAFFERCLNKAFSCQAVTSLVMPENLTDLGMYIFTENENLQNVRVECAEIPDFCFTRCSNLSQMTISRNVRKIGSNIINYCLLLESVTYEGSVADWSEVRKMQNWDGNRSAIKTSVLSRINCENGYFEYDSETKEWSERSA